MPSVSVSESTKKYLEKMRKRIGKDKIPNIKEITEKMVSFVQDNEEAFIKWAGANAE